MWLSENVTVPVGGTGPGGFTVTVAVKVTSCPTTDGLGDEDTVMVEAACWTTCVSPPSLGPKFVSPL